MSQLMSYSTVLGTGTRDAINNITTSVRTVRLARGQNALTVRFYAESIRLPDAIAAIVGNSFLAAHAASRTSGALKVDLPLQRFSQMVPAREPESSIMRLKESPAIAKKVQDLPLIPAGQHRGSRRHPSCQRESDMWTRTWESRLP